MYGGPILLLPTQLLLQILVGQTSKSENYAVPQGIINLSNTAIHLVSINKSVKYLQVLRVNKY